MWWYGRRGCEVVRDLAYSHAALADEKARLTASASEGTEERQWQRIRGLYLPGLIVVGRGGVTPAGFV